MPKFTRRPAEVEAQLYLGPSSVIEPWFADEMDKQRIFYKEGKLHVVLDFPTGHAMDAVADENEYVIRDAEGDLSIWPKDEFERQYIRKEN